MEFYPVIDFSRDPFVSSNQILSRLSSNERLLLSMLWQNSWNHEVEIDRMLSGDPLSIGWRKVIMHLVKQKIVHIRRL